ncbi:MAG: DUF2806 domain-containing protein [Saprospiraceae bacterium]
MTDLTGIGKPLAKLIDVMSRGLGELYRPKSIRSAANAEAYAIEALANANAKKALIEQDSDFDLVNRAKLRLLLQEIKHQENLETIADKSEQYLGSDASEDPVEEGWRLRFFEHAQNISETDLQEIWAQVLATEITNPSTISKRTLKLLADLSKEEAEAFEIICSLTTERKRIWKISGNDGLKEYGVDYGMLMQMREAGLVHSSDNLIYTYSIIAPEIGSLFPIGDQYYLVKQEQNPERKKFHFAQIALTDSGAELARVLNAPLNTEYVEALLVQREKEGFSLTELQVKNDKIDSD